MVVKKGSLITGMALLALLPGCWGRKKDAAKDHMNKEIALNDADFPLSEQEIVAQSDISLEEETLKSFFDDNIEDFVAEIEREESAQEYAQNEESATDALATQIEVTDNDEFAWVEENHDKVQEAFQTVYFDFNRHGLRDDQKTIVDKDIEHARAVLAQARQEGQEPTLVIEGHSCHSAGSSAYNLALSEKRAKAVADFFVSEGVARENIKIVGRGKEVPAVIDGKAVSGDREAQWPNRRVEVHVING